jgi:glycine amidinotransferase
VNVYTEWGPLKEVIVGNSININMDGFDKKFELLYRNFIEQLKKINKYDWKIKKQYTIERQEDLDNFADTLKDMGIRVRRPKRLDKVIVMRTPYFKAITNAVDSARDVFLCIGNEIIETPPTDRDRYFEGLMLRDVFMDYFRKGAKWTLGPRPRLAMGSTDQTHWSKVKKLHNIDEIEENFDISFDAANCLKFGKDILMNVGNKNHELGAIWLQRHLGEKFRVHPVRVCDCHIDGSLMPLKHGVLLLNPKMKKKMHLLPKPLQKWKTIIGYDGKGKTFNYPDDHFQLASFEGIGINVLSIDEKTVCVRTEDEIIQNRLKKEGFDVIPIQLRHCELFGGGLHCVTLDVNREELLEDYWNFG